MQIHLMSTVKLINTIIIPQKLNPLSRITEGIREFHQNPIEETRGIKYLTARLVM